MKNKYLVFVFVMLSINAFSQKQVQIRYGEPPSYISQMKDSPKTLTVSDSIKGVVAIYRNDSLIVIDSLAAIMILIETLQRQFEQQEKQSEIYFAASEILRYVNIDGFVLNKNRIKFNKAVVAYLKATKQKMVKSKIQRIDILVKDNKGNPLGWVKQ